MSDNWIKVEDLKHPLSKDESQLLDAQSLFKPLVQTSEPFLDLLKIIQRGEPLACHYDKFIFTTQKKDGRFICSSYHHKTHEPMIHVICGVRSTSTEDALKTTYRYRYGELLSKIRLGLVSNEGGNSHMLVTLVFNKWLVLQQRASGMQNGEKIYTYAVYQNTLHIKSHGVIHFTPPSKIFHSLPFGAPVFAVQRGDSKSPIDLIGFIGRENTEENIYPLLGPSSDANDIMVPLLTHANSKAFLKVREINLTPIDKNKLGKQKELRNANIIERELSLHLQYKDKIASDQAMLLPLPPDQVMYSPPPPTAPLYSPLPPPPILPPLSTTIDLLPLQRISVNLCVNLGKEFLVSVCYYNCDDQDSAPITIPKSVAGQNVQNWISGLEYIPERQRLFRLRYCHTSVHLSHKSNPTQEVFGDVVVNTHVVDNLLPTLETKQTTNKKQHYI